MLGPLGQMRVPKGIRDGVSAQLFEACKHPPQSITHIQELIESCPGVITYKDTEGRTALHIACGNRATVQVVVLLVQKWNDSVVQVTNKGMTPLHYACRFQASPMVVKYLIDRWPDSVKQTTESGWLPLHLACARHAPVEIVDFLVQEWPESVRRSTVDGRLPLHFALANIAPLSLVQHLVEKFPDTIQAKDANGWTPLHVACAYSKIEVAEYCIRRWRSGCMEKGSKGRIALHVVCWEKRPLRLVQYVKQQWQDSMRERDDDGLLPLHAACLGEAPLEVIKYLIGQWPASVWEIGKSHQDIVDYIFRRRHSDSQTVAEFSQWIKATIGNKLSFGFSPQNQRTFVPPLPLTTNLLVSSHMGTFKGSKGGSSSSEFQSSDISRDFIGSEEVGVCTRKSHESRFLHGKQEPSQDIGEDNSEWLDSRYSLESGISVDYLKAKGTGLHKACEAPQSLEIIRNLLLECPRAIGCLAFDGNLPIHTACLNQAPLSVLKILIDQHPQSLQEKDQHGNLPLHQACFSGAPLPSIKYLVRRYPDALEQTNQSGESPLDRARNPFFDAQDLQVIQWLENPYFDENDDFGEDDMNLLSASPTFVQTSRTDDLTGSRQRTLESVVAHPRVTKGGSEISPQTNTVDYGSSPKQTSQSSFSQPMGVNETRAALELLLSANLESRRGFNDVGGEETYAVNIQPGRQRQFRSTDVFSAPIDHTEAHSPKPKFSQAMGVEEVRTTLALLRSKNQAKRNQRHFVQYDAPGGERTGEGLQCQSDEIATLNDGYDRSGRRQRAINSPRQRQASDLDLNCTVNLIHNTTCESQEEEPFEIPRSVSAIYRSAVEEEHKERRSSIHVAGENLTDSEEMSLDEEPTVGEGDHRNKSQLSVLQNNRARRSLSSSSARILSRSASEGDADLGITNHFDSKPGIVQVNEPAIHPNSVMYRAAYNNINDISARPVAVASQADTIINGRTGLGTASSFYRSAMESASAENLPLPHAQNRRPPRQSSRARSFDEVFSATTVESIGLSAFLDDRLHGELARTSLISTSPASSQNTSFLDREHYLELTRCASSSSGASLHSRNSSFQEGGAYSNVERQGSASFDAPRQSVTHSSIINQNPAMSSQTRNVLRRSASDGSSLEFCGSQQLKRPGIVMVNEPAIHPNSVMYRAAYGNPRQQQRLPSLPRARPGGA